MATAAYVRLSQDRRNSTICAAVVTNEADTPNFKVLVMKEEQCFEELGMELGIEGLYFLREALFASIILLNTSHR